MPLQIFLLERSCAIRSLASDHDERKMSYEFDEDTRVARIGRGSYAGRLSQRWNIGPVPNGGYTMAVGVAALGKELAGLDPLTVTGHFLSPAAPGDARVHVDVIKAGRRYATAMARVEQEGRERLRLLATYGRFDEEGPTYVDAEPPALASLSATQPEPVPEGAPPIRHRFDARHAPETVRWVAGQRGERAEVRGWIRFADGRPADTCSLSLFADSFAPAVFNVTDSGWVPTLELTLHVRARPTSEWLRCAFRTRFMFGGLLEEDGEIWDESGRLVALSRQLAGAPRTR
jgi:acyl-CoA thioesterase